jgi:hypothetical protein
MGLYRNKEKDFFCIPYEYLAVYNMLRVCNLTTSSGIIYDKYILWRTDVCLDEPLIMSKLYSSNFYQRSIFGWISSPSNIQLFINSLYKYFWTICDLNNVINN